MSKPPLNPAKVTCSLCKRRWLRPRRMLLASTVCPDCERELTREHKKCHCGKPVNELGRYCEAHDDLNRVKGT